MQKYWHNLLVVVLVNLLVGGSGGLLLAQKPPTQLTEKIDAVFRPILAPDKPGCAVQVLHHGEVAFQRGYGIARLGVTTDAISPQTNFRLASLTKQFTAMAIMLLVHDGKLHYDDRLTSIFPDFPAYGRAITVRDLLHHTSGLVDYEDLMNPAHGYPTPVAKPGEIPQIQDDQVLALLKLAKATKFAPGSQWEYSNSGYVILGLIVRQVSGTTFATFLHDRIFSPLGMDQSLAYVRGQNNVTHRAYGNTLDKTKWQETDQSDTSATLGDGGVYTSLQDLAKWDRALRQNKLLTAAEMAPAFTPATLADGSPAPYGFGWFLDPYRGHRRNWHYGETMGFRTGIHRFPDDHLTVIVLCNRQDLDPAKLATQVADLYLN